MKQKIMNRLEECYQIAERTYGVVFPRPKMVFSNRLKTCGGHATCMISLNGEVSNDTITLSNAMIVLNGDDFVNEVVGHEVAHLVASRVQGANVGHGHRWKEVMAVFGQPANRCHRLKVVRGTAQKRYTYCDSNGDSHVISAIRHSRIQKGMIYRVGSTGAMLDYSGLVS